MVPEKDIPKIPDKYMIYSQKLAQCPSFLIMFCGVSRHIHLPSSGKNRGTILFIIILLTFDSGLNNI